MQDMIKTTFKCKFLIWNVQIYIILSQFFRMLKLAKKIQHALKKSLYVRLHLKDREMYKNRVREIE